MAKTRAEVEAMGEGQAEASERDERSERDNIAQEGRAINGEGQLVERVAEV